MNWEPRGDPDAVLDTVKVEVWDVVDNGIQRDDAALSEADFDAQGERLAGLAKKRTGKSDRLNKTGRSSKTKTGWYATKQQRGSLTHASGSRRHAPACRASESPHRALWDAPAGGATAEARRSGLTWLLPRGDTRSR